jgi:hypothetical protein
MSMAAIIAAVVGAGPSFGQGMAPAGSAPPAAAPAPSGGGGAAMSRGGGGAPQNAGPRGGNRGGIVGGGNVQGRSGVVGGGNRQAWRDGRHHRGGYHRGYRGGYGGGVYFGTAPFFGGPYAYDDGYYVEGPPAGGDVAYCMRRFKSYDPGSGTYLGYDGLRHPCP